jgi:hypothetical protein
MTREPTEMELRVAQVIGNEIRNSMIELYFPDFDLNDTDTPEYPDFDYPDLEQVASAAIRAMREPTTGMLRACDLFALGTDKEIAFTWQEMIDAASPPEDK